MYSGTSDSGPSEIGTQYNRPLYKGQGPKNLLPYILLIHFEPPTRGQPLYTKDTTAEFKLSPTCPLFGGSIVLVR